MITTKKWILFCVIIVVFLFLFFAFLTTGFKMDRFSKRIYKPQNVYEEIWNLVVTEKLATNKTVLTTVPEDTYVDFDFGHLGIHINDLHGCHLVISWGKNEDEMEYSFYYYNLDNRECIDFIYNYKTKALYGEEEFSYFLDHFLNDYFNWCEISLDFDPKYSVDSLGDFTFVLVE